MLIDSHIISFNYPSSRLIYWGKSNWTVPPSSLCSSTAICIFCLLNKPTIDWRLQAFNNFPLARASPHHKIQCRISRSTKRVRATHREREGGKEMKTESTDIADFWLEADDNVVVVRVRIVVFVVDADRRINRLSLSTHLSSSAIQAYLLSCILLLSLSLSRASSLSVACKRKIQLLRMNESLRRGCNRLGHAASNEIAA